MTDKKKYIHEFATHCQKTIKEESKQWIVDAAWNLPYHLPLVTKLLEEIISYGAECAVSTIQSHLDDVMEEEV